MNSTGNWLEWLGRGVLEASVRTTVIIAGLFVLAWLARKLSASFRNVIWRICVLAFLLTPVAMSLLPRVDLVILPSKQIEVQSAPTSAHSSGNLVPLPEDIPLPPQETAAPAASRAIEHTALPFNHVVVLAWMAGAGFFVARIGASLWKLRALDKQAQLLADPTLVAVVTRNHPRAVIKVKEGSHPPLTYGWRRPVILVSTTALSWSAERWRIAMAHEAAHIQRRDFCWNILGELAVALFWFHPLAWLANKFMRMEAEHAADDLTLASGARPIEYASELLALAGHAESRFAVAMASAGKLERRIASILNPSASRAQLSGWQTFALGSLASAALLGVACATPRNGGAMSQKPERPAPKLEVSSANDSPPELTIVGWHNPKRIPHPFSVWAKYYTERDAVRALENNIRSMNVVLWEPHPSLWLMFRSRLTDEESFGAVEVTDAENNVLVKFPSGSKESFIHVIGAHKDQHPMGWTPSDDGVIFLGKVLEGVSGMPERVNVTLHFSQGDWDELTIPLEPSVANDFATVEQVQQEESVRGVLTRVAMRLKELPTYQQRSFAFQTRGGAEIPASVELVGRELVLSGHVPTKQVERLVLRTRPIQVATYRNISLPKQEGEPSELFTNNQNMQRLAGRWAGATWGEGIITLGLEGGRKFQRDFGSQRQPEAGSWLVERHRLKLLLPGDSYDLDIMALENNTLRLRSSDGREMSFLRIVEPPARALTETEQRLVGLWMTRRGFFLAQLRLKADGSFESSLAGETLPIATGTWEGSDGKVRLITLSAHNAEDIGKTQVYAWSKTDLGEEMLLREGFDQAVAFFRRGK